MIMKMKSNELTAPVSEVFFSYQGEGPFFGEPQIFVRFFGCNISCDYCDTKPVRFSEYMLRELLNKIKSLGKLNSMKFPGNEPVFVVLTGGEPLVRRNFLIRLLPLLKQMRFKTMLETNGILYRQLRGILKYLDIVSMDIKLPSECGGNFFIEHAGFLRLCREKAYVKIVVTNKTGNGEFLKALELISSVSKKIPLVLQAVSPGKKSVEPSEPHLKQLIEIAGKKLERVYLIPQMQKVWKVR